MIKALLFGIAMMIIPAVQALAPPLSALSKHHSLLPPAVQTIQAMASATTLSTQPLTATVPPVALRARSGASVSAQPKSPAYEQPLHILVFSGTAAFRHMSLSQGIQMILDQSPEQNWVVTATTDGALFDDRLLPRFDVIIFLNPSGCQEEEGMRSFYSGFGHTHESFENPLIVEHLTRAINWAGKRK